MATAVSMSDEDIKPRSKRRGLLSALASNLGKVGKKQNDRERTSAHLYKKFSDLAAEHNRHCEPNHRVQISPQYSSEDAEEGSADQSDFTRFLAYTPFWALSVKSSWTSLACFLIPTTELLRIDSAEGPTTRKLDLRGRLRDHQLCWSMDGNEA